MCFSQPKPPSPPKPPPLPPAPKPPAPPPAPAPAPKALQAVGSAPDLRIGAAKQSKSNQSNRVNSNSLRGSLNISGNSGGLNT